MIGGEFEIDLSTQRDTFTPMPNTYYYASGRAALYQILKSLRTKCQKVWFPDWLCHTMVEAAEKAGFECQYYELNQEYKVSVEALDAKGYRDGDVVLMINYFGLQDLVESTKMIKSTYPHVIVIEDDVQAFYCFIEDQNPYADYRFTSPRKAFGIPDGGLVSTQHEMPWVSEPNTFASLKIQAGVMKSNRSEGGIKDEDYLALFEKGSELIDVSYDSVMSEDGQKLFAGTDFLKVQQCRKENADYLLEGLKTLGIDPLIEVPVNKTPLFIPIFLENRSEVRKKMFSHQVFCPIHWPSEGLMLRNGMEMAEHELSLIIDQRYGIEDMNTILNLLNNH